MRRGKGSARHAPPNPHLHRHEQDPHGGQAEEDPRRSRPNRRRRRDVRARWGARTSSSPEDAGRLEPAFLHRILTAVVEAGATTLNIPDTVGICLPEEFGASIAGISVNVPGDYVISHAHGQNDLGLSTANSLAGVANGARQVECTVNGIGERAGNASLEEVAMAIWMRGAEKKLFGDHSAYTGISRVHLPASKMVKDFSGMAVQPHKAIVETPTAFAHESGIHQDGMLKNQRRRTRSSRPRRSGISAARTRWAW